MLPSELAEQVQAWAEKRGITVEEALEEAADWWVDEQPELVEALAQSGKGDAIPLEQLMAELEAPYRRQLIFTPAEDDETGWVVTVPSLPGCVTQGDTLAEAADHIVEAMEVYIETLEEKGWEVPQDISSDIYEAVARHLTQQYERYVAGAEHKDRPPLSFSEWAAQ